MPNDTSDNLTEADRRNGWTVEALAAYRLQREAVHQLVGGNEITIFKRPKAQKRLIGASSFNPHKW